jgi:hypothetical protein
VKNKKWTCFFPKAWIFILGEWECCKKETVENGKNDYKWKKLEPKKDGPGWLSRLESKQEILVLHYSVGWWMPHSTAVGRHLITFFSKIFIYNHYFHIPSFLSLSTPTPPKWISKLLEKNSFIFYFSQILKLLFFFIFSYSSSGTYSAPLDQVLWVYFKLVLWISGIQNKQPKITVHPLYVHRLPAMRYVQGITVDACWVMRLIGWFDWNGDQSPSPAKCE